MARAKSPQKRLPTPTSSTPSAPAATVSPADHVAALSGALDGLRAAQDARDHSRAIAFGLQAGYLFEQHQMAQVKRGVRMGAIPRPVHPNLSRGRKRRALDLLGRVLCEILEGDPYQPAKDVLSALRSRAERHDPVIRRVERAMHEGRRRVVIGWHDPSTGRKHTVPWSSIVADRLPRYRKMLNAPHRSRAPRL